MKTFILFADISLSPPTFDGGDSRPLEGGVVRVSGDKPFKSRLFFFYSTSISKTEKAQVKIFSCTKPPVPFILYISECLQDISSGTIVLRDDGENNPKVVVLQCTVLSKDFGRNISSPPSRL